MSLYKKEYIIDGTECPIQTDTYKQQEDYRGKKKMHTMKSSLIVLATSLVVWLSQNFNGKVHDKTRFQI